MPHDPALLLDMLIAARRVQQFTKSATRESFEADDILSSASYYQLQIIGEAANQVSRAFQEAHSEIPWGPIIGLRHRLVHNYARMNVEQIWDILQHHVPPLIPALEQLIPPDRPT